jgi:hypothetical protein
MQLDCNKENNKSKISDVNNIINLTELLLEDTNAPNLMKTE